MLAPFTILSSAFFDRDPRRVARALLGKLLIRKTRGGILAGRIVETEAYLGTGDLAAHAVAGKTARNYVLFGPPGFAYVYFIYGNHYCFNVSCLPDGVPGGVLFRALEPVSGIEEMARARGICLPRGDNIEHSNQGARLRKGAEKKFLTAESAEERKRSPQRNRRNLRYLRSIASGPGRMCEALGITRERDNDKNLASPRSDLQIVDDGYRVRRVAVGPRIGITKSASEPLRYVIAENPFVSILAPKK